MIRIAAELASAHEGKLDCMLRLIDAANSAGADTVKFQIYKADELAVKYYKGYKLYKQLEFSENQWKILVTHARDMGLDVMADIFDTWGLEIMETNGATGYKLQPGMIWELELLARVAATGKKSYLGVGGISLRDIRKALKTLQENGAHDVCLVHGFQGYPTRIEDTNMARLGVLSRLFKLPVGFADHLDGESPLSVWLPAMALGYGAAYIEKHLTLDRAQKGLDYYSALNPAEFSVMVENIRNACVAVGSGDVTSIAENEYVQSTAKKIVARNPIRSNEYITRNNIAFKRSPVTGILPSQANSVLYRKASRNIGAGQTLTKDSAIHRGIGVLVAVRMKSTRLPHKALLVIEGKSVIEHLLERVRAARLPSTVVLCTSTHPDDAILIDMAQKAGTKWYAGSEEDVMARFLGAAQQESLDIIVRATGDNPLTDPHYIDLAIARLLDTGADYVRAAGMPVGTFCEVFTKKALAKAHRLAIDPNYSEYMSFYFWNNPDVFKIETLACDADVMRPKYRLTVDERADLKLMRAIYGRLYHGGQIFTLKEVVDLLDSEPNLAALNSGVNLKWRDDKAFIDMLNKITRFRQKAGH